MKKYKKNSIFVLIGILFTLNCKSVKKLADFYKISNVNKITNSYNNKIFLTISEEDTMNQIINIINNSERIPMKFIALEEIEIYTDNQTYLILRNKEAIKLDGITFKLKDAKSDKLSALIGTVQSPR